MCSSRTQWLKGALRDGGPLSLILLAHLPLVVIHFSHLWQTGLHSHFPLILIAAVLMLWQRWDGNREPGRWQVLFAGAALTAGFFLLLFGVLIWSPWLGYFGTLITVFAVLLRTSPAPVKEWCPPWLLLWLLIPLPMGLDRRLAHDLQSRSTHAASLLLDFFHVNHLQTGNLLVIPGMKFSVEEACTGIHSLFVLISAAAVLAVLRRHWWLHTVALIASSVVWAVTANMLRITGVIVAASQFGLDLSTGWRHQVWGFSLFAIAFGMILSTDRILWVLFGPEEDAEVERDDVPVLPTRRTFQDSAENIDAEPDRAARLGVFQSWTVAGMFVCLGLMQSVPRTHQASQPTPTQATRYDFEAVKKLFLESLRRERSPSGEASHNSTADRKIADRKIADSKTRELKRLMPLYFCPSFFCPSFFCPSFFCQSFFCQSSYCQSFYCRNRIVCAEPAIASAGGVP